MWTINTMNTYAHMIDAINGLDEPFSNALFTQKIIKV